MKILALDSTALTATVALCEEERLLGLYTLNSGNTQSETLLPMVESLMHLMKWEISDIDLFACSRGPGSFTGVRIGAATVKGLAFGTGKPCIGVSTLEALAYHLMGLCGDQDAILCPVMNARRGQVYNALFRVSNGTMIRLCEDRALSIAELENELLNYHDPIYLSGDGYDITRQSIKQLELPQTPELLRYQNAHSVAMVALAAYRNGVRTTDAELSPSYLRLPQAERERNERLAREAAENTRQSI